MINISKSLIIGFITIALFYLFQTIGIIPYVLFIRLGHKTPISMQHHIISTSYANSIMTLTFGGDLFVIIAILAIGYFYKRNEFKKEFKFNSFNFKKLPYIIFLGAGASLTLNMFIGILFSYIIKTNTGQTLQILDTSNNVFSILQTILIAPIAEELVFRGFLFNYFNKQHSTKIAIILSALFFAIMHADLSQGIPAFIMGIILANIYIYTNSIYGNILLHIAANTISLLLVFLEKSLIPILGNNVATSITGLIYIFYGLIFLFIAIYSFKKIECKKKRLKYLIFSILLILTSSILILSQFFMAK